MSNLRHYHKSGLKLVHFKGPQGFWQHVDRDNRQVGPQYGTKAEALSDTEDYAMRAGWLLD